MLENNFVHLNIHSDFSIKDGLCKINSLLSKIKDLRMSAVALTDFFSLSGVIKFVRTSYNFNIKPIVGVDVYIYYKNANIAYPLTILVLNNNGYKNLMQLISQSYRANIIYLIEFNFLLKHHKGLLFIFSLYYIYNNRNYILKLSHFKDKIFDFWGKILFNRIYLNIFRINNINQEKYINVSLKISYFFKLPLVATNKVLFLNHKDYYAHKIRTAIYHGCHIDKVNKIVDHTDQQFLKNSSEMCSLFSDIPESIINSIEISKRCNFFLKKNNYILPKYPFNKGITSAKYLEKISYIKLKKKKCYLKNKKKYLNRLKKELYVINKIGFPDYFLIVMEFVNWAKKNNIFVGPGRGSGAGSLVSFVLNITDIDPLKFGLIFERFLNLERLSMPDLDIDFCMNRRDEVIDHIENLYGKNFVSQIVTFNTMTAKSVVRDVGRTLGYSYSFVDYIARLIPYGFSITLKKAIKEEKKLFDLYKNDFEVKSLLNFSINLEGIIKGVSKHAGGVVITSKTIDNYCPTFFDKITDKLVTQYDKDDVEYIGLIKFDLLGLKTLTTISNSIDIINYRNKKYFNKKKISINKISLFDEKSFDLLRKSKTTGVFQLESKGMRDLIFRLKPNSFKDIVDLLALFRPGPLQSGMVDNFINRKNRREKIYYPTRDWQHELLIPILKPTYGVILYQEQVMKIARVLANYSFSSADMLRIAMGKKKHDEMKLHREIFKNGAIYLKINVNIALNIFSLMEKFSSYGFNKSHSVSYAYLAYQTLWLKANYPAEFMSSFINSDIDNNNKVVLILNEIKNMNIKIIPPDINNSFYFFKVNKYGHIIYGLGAIKGLGKNSINHIVNIRNRYGNFSSFINFCVLTFSTLINKLVLEKLIFAGCFDIFNIDRSVLFYFLKKIIDLSRYKNNLFDSKQLSLLNSYDYFYNILSNKMVNTKIKCSMEDKLHKEREVLGLYITDHPVNLYFKYYNFLIKKKKFTNIKDLCFLRNNSYVFLLGLIVYLKVLNTKNNYFISILKIDDNTGVVEVILFKDIYKKYIDIIELYTIVYIYGFLKNSNNIYNISLIAKKIKSCKNNSVFK